MVYCAGRDRFEMSDPYYRINSAVMHTEGLRESLEDGLRIRRLLVEELDVLVHATVSCVLEYALPENLGRSKWPNFKAFREQL